VIAHQAIAVDADAEAIRLLAQQREISRAVVVDEKHVLPVVAPLRDMMWTPRHHQSSDPWHVINIQDAFKFVKNNR